ncbi:class I SAM-dependent methyltransferase [Nocardioides marmorisolisilvae]|uniref:Methyltransferase domain-containing protein n=1 Tax=Nocardioides marmorisolisilvae TaxID=1542737 RepID=A0A3N0DTH0_9ACTN|nr:methyltransferase domain-containing protein [Nocardioides marmorisolisilvae]RNL78811.1 methyltransferase domain-containing protein [Nocardioides marmorisolisilvae]
MTEATNVHQQAYVREAWELIELMERIGPTQTASAFAPRWEAARRKGEDFYAPVASGEWFVTESRDLYESPTNRTRFARTVDFIRPGERIMEIGTGKGFLALMALKAGQAAAYRGIELVPTNVTATNAALKANGYADRATAEVGDLYDLTRDTVAEHDTDLLICCEVLEHVPDPEAALKVLADSLPEGTDLLVSVPLRGRLEGIWGHVAQFGVARVRAMARAAGLTVHHVEPLANTWVFMLASRAPSSERAALAAAAEPDVTADLTTPEDWSLRVDNVKPEASESTWNKNLASYAVQATEKGVRLTAEAQKKRKKGETAYAGITFACQDIRGIRLELALGDIDLVEAFYVDAYAGSERLGRWKWVPADGRPKQAKPTFMLQPQLRGTFFKRQSAQDLRTADRVDLFAQLPAGGTVDVTVTRLGWFR